MSDIYDKLISKFGEIRDFELMKEVITCFEKKNLEIILEENTIDEKLNFEGQNYDYFKLVVPYKVNFETKEKSENFVYARTEIIFNMFKKI